MKRSLSLLMLVLFLVSCGSDKSSPLAPTAVALTAVAPPPPPPPLWMASGTGATILDMPTRLTRIRIEGVFTGRGENFIVWCGATGTTGRSLLVNEILGTRYESTTYSGVHSALRRSGDPCGELEIRNSQRLRWTFTEERSRSVLSPTVSTGSEAADLDAVMRSRNLVLER